MFVFLISLILSGSAFHNAFYKLSYGNLITKHLIVATLFLVKTRKFSSNYFKSKKAMAAANKFGFLVRAMSSSTKAVKPPIQVFGLEGRYATALYSAASKSQQLDQVEKDITNFQDSLKKDKKLRELVVSPIINKRVMAKAMKETADKAGMTPTSGNLLSLLADNGRLNMFDGIANAFRMIMAAHRGEVVCEVITAKPLDASQSKQLESSLKAFLKSNETLKVTSRVDPNIIGGMIVSIGDKYVDMSIASKVKMYTDIISSAA
uniref:Oligomycin sensitivity conferral protein n=1 Tax=Glossina brevipalpis TaxID=37001 RepID=A0A1A9X437_9MUSC